MKRKNATEGTRVITKDDSMPGQLANLRGVIIGDDRGADESAPLTVRVTKPNGHTFDMVYKPSELRRDHDSEEALAQLRRKLSGADDGDMTRVPSGSAELSRIRLVKIINDAARAYCEGQGIRRDIRLRRSVLMADAILAEHKVVKRS